MLVVTPLTGLPLAFEHTIEGLPPLETAVNCTVLADSWRLAARETALAGRTPWRARRRRLESRNPPTAPSKAVPSPCGKGSLRPLGPPEAEERPTVNRRHLPIELSFQGLMQGHGGGRTAYHLIYDRCLLSI